MPGPQSSLSNQSFAVWPDQTYDQIVNVYVNALVNNTLISCIITYQLPGGGIGSTSIDQLVSPAGTGISATYALQGCRLLSVTGFMANTAGRGVGSMRVVITAASVPSMQYEIMNAVLKGTAPACWIRDGTGSNLQNDAKCDVQTFAVSNPAAGVDFSHSFLLEGCQELIAISGTLTTSATVGNRTPSFYVNINGQQLLYVANPAAPQTASQAINYNVAPYQIAPGPLTGFSFLSMPNGISYGRNSSLGVVTSGLLAGDQWSSVRISGRFFVETT